MKRGNRFEEFWFPLIIIVLAIAGTIWLAIWLAFPTHAVGATAFDHSECQYPNRQSNPPDGCDNSDPARPECMKIGIEDCDLPLQDGSTPTNPITTPPAASQSVIQSKPITCTGN